MDNSLFATITSQLYETAILCGAFFKKLNWMMILGGLILLYVIFMRTWEFKKIGRLFLSLAFLLIVFVRLEAFFQSATFSPEGSQMAVAILRVVFAIVTACVLVYHVAIKE